MDEPDSNKFLAQLTLAALKGLTDSIKKTIVEFWHKYKYGVTIKAEEATALKKIAENDFYRLFKHYLGEHWSIKLIKVGLFISELNEAGKRERAKALQDEAYRRYGPKGARIIQLASTGILMPVMDYIIDLKKLKGANCFVLCQTFDKILDEWDAIAVPINANSEVEDAQRRVLQKMETGHSIFFVYAAGSAAKIAQLCLAQMNNDNRFDGRYLMTATKLNIVNNVEYCVWSFEKIQDAAETIMGSKVRA